MPFRAPNTGSYSTPKGYVTRKKSGAAKSYTGKGAAPAGTTKVREPSYSEVPVTTVSSTGKVTTSGFKSPGAARKARRRAVAATAATLASLGIHPHQAPPKPKKRSQRLVTYKAPATAKLSSLPKPAPFPTSKPKNFTGKPTAGTPTRSELTKAKAAGTLKVNRQGYVTTPKVRKVAKKVQRAKKVVAKTRKATRLHSPIVTTPEQSKVTRTVLNVGQKMGANRKERLAAIATGLQESGMKNLPGGTGTSAGWRQEESQYYPEPRNVKKGAQNFFNEAKTDTGGARGRGETIPHLAQAIQASGAGESYYADNVGEAKTLLKQYNKGKPNPKALKQLQAAQKEAKGLGLKSGNVKATPKQETRYKGTLQTMKQIDSKHYGYQWGGGHAVTGSPTGGPGTGFDCSGAISAMLHLKAPLTSGSMGSVLKSGPGRITVFYNSEHTFAYIPALHKYWGTSESNPGGGAGFFPKSVGDSEVASGNSAGAYSVGHVGGLGQLVNVKNFTLPGMTLSSSGTTATINPGSGATVTTPGFSSKPIRLTAAQKRHRILKKLESVGIGGGKTEPTESKGKTLKELEDKYLRSAA